MQRYIQKLLLPFGHNLPAKPQLSSHKHIKINHGSKVQLVPEEAAIPSIDANGIKRVQAIVGSAFLYGRACLETN